MSANKEQRNMRYLQTHLVLAILLIGIFSCGSTEDPVDVKEPTDETMESTGAIQGTVQNIDGVTIQVRLLKDGQPVSTTNADTNFEFADIVTGNYIVQITAKGYETIETNVAVEDGQVVKLDKATLVALVVPVSHLTGELTHQETGEPLSGVLVQLLDQSGNENEVITSVDGIYSFENLPVNQPFTLKVFHYGFERQEIEVNAIPENKTAELNVELSALPSTKKLDPSEGIELGTLAPDFELTDSTGSKHSLSETLRSKNVVVVFYRGDF